MTLSFLFLSLCAAVIQASPGSLADAHREAPGLSEDVVAVVHDLETFYHDHPGYRHYFWDFMARATYDLDFLRQYALYYYEHVRFFRLYLAGAMTVVPVEGFQVALAETIADEFGVRLWGEPDVDGHPELFRRFMRSLNLTEADWGRLPSQKNLLPGIAHYRRVHYGLFRADLAEEMVGAIVFGMERTTPHRHSSVLKGIRKVEQRFGVQIDSQFFSEHVSVDDYHNTALIDPLSDWFTDNVKVQRMRQGVVQSFDARKEFLDSLADTLGVPVPDTQPVDSVAGQFPSDIVVGFEWRAIESLTPHEQCDPDRRNALKNQLEVEKADGVPTISALTVTESGIIVDGHHRWNALKLLGYTHAPCMVIRYDHPSVVVCGDPDKDDVVIQANNGIMFPAKTTQHMVVDKKGTAHPVNVLSPVVHIRINAETN